MKIYDSERGYLVLGKKKRISHGKVAKNFSGVCNLNQLPDYSYFKLVKKDGSLSKQTYLKQKGDYDRSTKRYYVCSVDDVWGNGRRMKPDTKVSTKFVY